MTPHRPLIPTKLCPMTERDRDQDEFYRGPDGKPLLDRYGRPIRRRPRPTTSAPRPEPARREQPIQQFPAQTPPTRQQPVQRMAQPTEQRMAQPTAQRPYSYSRPQSTPGQAPPPARGRRRPRRIRFGGCLGTLAFLLVCVLALGAAGLFWIDGKLNRTAAIPATRVANTPGTNWLLVGSDSRTGFTDEEANRLGTGGDIGSTRTDTIMLLHLPRSGQPTLISIPRDSYVNVPGYGGQKINSAYTFGGAPLLTQTVEEATGLRIDHYAEIGMGGLANVVDALGGVQLCPTEPINDPLAGINVEPGCQPMDGPTALGYVRTRATALGDLDRVQRQREFFSALMAEATQGSTLANPFQAFPMASAVAESFTVGEKDHAWHLARMGLAMRGGITTETVPYAGFADYDVGNVVLWDDAAAQQLFHSLK